MDAIPLQNGLVTPIIWLVILLITIVVVSQSIEIVKAYEKSVLTVFGQYHKILEPGVNFVFPFISRTYPVDIRTQQLDIPSQTALSKDDVPVTADLEIFLRVADVKAVFLTADNPAADDLKESVSNRTRTISNHAQTGLQDILGEMEFSSVNFDDMDRNERETLWMEIRTRIENDYEERTGIDPHAKSNDNWQTIQGEIHDRAISEFEDIDEGLKERMEIHSYIIDRLQEDLNMVTDGLGIDIVHLDIQLTLDPNNQGI
ncbi:SPFH domain-containing protein [Halocatena marina]|uniref:SPFH domain-containing protein n=1 Tax=Halocatena marina TaxID=2934937 RepID=UPI00200BE02A|nr:SPFH domain-containing protein [Halocatena marina]